MRPPSVYAKRSCPAGDPCDLLRLLHGPHRVGLRLVMILLSQQGWTAAAIAELLGCDPRTVRRWVHRYNQEDTDGLADRPRAGRPRLGSRRLGARIRRLLGQPKAWTIGLLHLYLGRPAMSLRTLHRRVREVAAWQRPRLVAKGDPDRDQVLTELYQQLGDLPSGAVVLAEDETHVNLLPWVRASWIPHGSRQQVMTPGTNRRRTIFGQMRAGSARLLAGPAPLGRSSARRSTRAGLPSPSEDGGLEEFDESLPSRRSSSASRACSVTIRRACSALAARSSAITAAWTATVASSSGSGEGMAASTTRSGQARLRRGPYQTATPHAPDRQLVHGAGTVPWRNQAGRMRLRSIMFAAPPRRLLAPQAAMSSPFEEGRHGHATSQPAVHAWLRHPRPHPGQRPAAVVVGGAAAARLAQLLGRNQLAGRAPARHAGLGRLARGRLLVLQQPGLAQGA
jgi:transposase